MMDIHHTYCGNNFTMYVSQISMLGALNVNSAVCKIHLNKTGKGSKLK